MFQGDWQFYLNHHMVSQFRDKNSKFIRSFPIATTESNRFKRPIAGWRWIIQEGYIEPCQINTCDGDFLRNYLMAKDR